MKETYTSKSIAYIAIAGMFKDIFWSPWNTKTYIHTYEN